MIRFLIAPFAAVALMGCAHTTASSPSATPKAALPGAEQCLFSTQVRGWKVIDDQTLVVEAPTGSTAYLFKLFAPVTGLQFQETLAFIDGDHNAQLCSNGDELAVGKPMPQRVPITSVRLLSKEEADTLRKPKPRG